MTRKAAPDADFDGLSLRQFLHCTDRTYVSIPVVSGSPARDRSGEFLALVISATKPMSAPRSMHDDDAALVARCLDSDASAWALLVRRYQRLVFAIVRRAGLDEHAAGDVFQTVFVRLMESLARIEEPHRLQAWIVTTAKRETLLQLGRSRRMVSMTPIDESSEGAEWDMPDTAPLPEEVLADLQELEQVRTALDKLDGRCRELLRLLFRDADAIAYDDVARELGMPVGSIGPTRARCLEKLRRLVG